MFDSEQTLTNRLYDAIDLAIDFATLGEYGLEPVGSTRQGCEGARTRPLPITDRETFSEVLFPNRHRGASPSAASIGAATEASCSVRSRAKKEESNRGLGRKLSRKRGGRGASGATAAGGAA